MKKYSFNCIPSFEDISFNKNNRLNPEMLVVLSRNSIGSMRSIEHIEIDDHPIFQEDNNISFDLFQQEDPPHKAIPIITQEFMHTPSKKKKNGCVCKKTACLKLYCECFANGKLCTEDCACINCCNVAENKEGISSARNLRKNRLRAG